MTTSEGEGNFRGECYPLGLCHGLQDIKALMHLAWPSPNDTWTALYCTRNNWGVFAILSIWGEAG